MKRARGFTLIEVLLAASIMTVALTLILSGFSTCLRAAAEARRYTEAALLLERKIAELEMADSLEVGSEEGQFEDDDGEVEYPGYTWRVEIEEAEDVENLLVATVTISWRDRGRDRSVEVTRLFAKKLQEES